MHSLSQACRLSLKSRWKQNPDNGHQILAFSRNLMRSCFEKYLKKKSFYSFQQKCFSCCFVCFVFFNTWELNVVKRLHGRLIREQLCNFLKMADLLC